MKPKERFINYALLSSTNNCVEPNQSSYHKEDIPIDLSVKKQPSVSVVVPAIAANDVHHFGLYREYEHRTSFLSPPPPSHIGDWPSASAGRYCFPNLMAAKHYHPYHPSNLFPYLFINPGCLTGSPEIDQIKKPIDSTILDHYAMPYRLHSAQDGILFPFTKINDHHHHFNNQFHHSRDRQSSHGDNPLLSTESSSSSSSSSPYEYHIPEYIDVKNGVMMKNSQGKSQNSVNHHHHDKNNQTKNNGSQVAYYDPKAKLKKALSYPSLPSMLKDQIMVKRNNILPPLSLSSSFLPHKSLFRSKSECNLHLIKSNYSSSVNVTTTTSITVAATAGTTKICAPKKLFASNYYQNILKENLKESRDSNDDDRKELNKRTNQSNIMMNGNNRQQQINNETIQTRFYRNYRKEVIECWDNERRDSEQQLQHSIDNKGCNSTNNNILDLRTSTTINSNHNNPTVFKTTTVHNNMVVSNVKIQSPDKSLSSTKCIADCTNKVEPPAPALPSIAFSNNNKQPLGHPLDLYKQYYYYLMQEPSFASRAAVAVAETYAKLFSNSNSPEENTNLTSLAIINSNNNNKSSPSSTDKSSSSSFENNSLYETKRTSPDCSQDGSRTELRSADTTNGNIMFDRKRISRPLTGKHVRHGTGASPSTLVSLRNMIQQRQKLKEIGKLDCNIRYGKGKANKRIKRK